MRDWELERGRRKRERKKKRIEIAFRFNSVWYTKRGFDLSAPDLQDFSDTTSGLIHSFQSFCGSRSANHSVTYSIY